MNWLIPNRQHVAQLKYQLRKFEGQCAGLPETTRARISSELQGLRRLLMAHTKDNCEDVGQNHSFERPPFSLARYCVACDMMHPDDVPPVEVSD